MSNTVTPIEAIKWTYAPAKRAGRFAQGGWSYPRPGFGRMEFRLQEVVVDDAGAPVVIGDVIPTPVVLDFSPADFNPANPTTLVWHDSLTGLPDPSKTMTAAEFLGWNYSAGRLAHEREVARRAAAANPPAPQEPVQE